MGGKNRIHHMLSCTIVSFFVVLSMFIVTAVSSKAAPEESNSSAVQLKEDSYRILFLSSYSYSWGSVPAQLDGITSALDHDKYIITSEFMDTKNTTYSDNYAQFYQLLKFKLQNRKPYDAVIVGDDAALNFVQLYKKELFPDAHIVYEGIDNVENGEKAVADGICDTGVVEVVDYSTNLALAHKIFPKATDLVIIYDDMENGIGIAKQLWEQSKYFKSYHVTYINSSQYSSVEMSKILHSFDQNDIVFFSSMGRQLGGHLYTETEAYSMARNQCNIPLFRFTEAGVGNGMLGGYIVDHEKSGVIAGQMLRDILENNKVAPIDYATPYKYYFDYNILHEYHIQTAELPKNSDIINVPDNFFRRHYSAIMFIMGTLIVAGFIIFCISRFNNNKLRRANNKLRKAENDLLRQYEEKKLYVDFLERKEAQIKYQAEHDGLTKLYNRHTAIHFLEELIRSGSSYAVIGVDIDDFKSFNETMGHMYGDMVLCNVADIITDSVVQYHGMVARFGGDEFLLIICDVTSQDVADYVHRLRDKVICPIRFGEEYHNITCCAGIMLSTDSAQTSAEAIAYADLALNVAKQQGKDSMVYYNEKMRSDLDIKYNIGKSLEKACLNDGFIIRYQPQVDAMTGEFVGCEALLRLKDNSFFPGEFIPVAEQSELIIQIGRIVTEKVVRQLYEWKLHGRKIYPVAINYSSKQLRDEEYVSFLQEMLDKYEIPPEYVEIEITEGMFLENSKAAIRLFDDLTAMHIKLALDDFGTGYSSINYLTYVPVSKIKIDKTIVDNFLNDEKEDFIGHLIGLAHSLHLKITVEGIETKDQYERIKKMEGDNIQGYYFSKPITAEEIEELSNPMVGCENL